jgi:hypothetical protein
VRAVVCFYLLGCIFTPGLDADTFIGTAPTGLIELPGYKYPVFLFVPPNYKPDREYTLMVAVSEEGGSPKDTVEYWMSNAKRQSFLVLAPSILWPQDVPYQMDRWLIEMKEDVCRRYRVGKNKIFITGSGSGADYASYLAVNYPREFSAAAVLGSAWSGRLGALVRPTRRKSMQPPFLVALPGGAQNYADIERKALKLEQKGYPVYLLKVDQPDQMGTLEFKKKILDWLQEYGERRQQIVRESRKSWVEKTRSAVENFFRVQ